MSQHTHIPIVEQEDQQVARDDENETTESPIFNTDGLRVLAVDDSLVCLKVLVALLHQCKYNVTGTTNPVEALKILRTRKHEFDIVITDLRMMEMDGLVLLQKISLEMDLPVVMLSADDKQENIMRAIRYGARDYIIKPPTVAQIKNVWQHVVRKRLFGSKCSNDANNTSSVTKEEETKSGSPLVDESKRKHSELEGSSGKEDDGAASNLDGSSKKKRRVNWTADLHNKFVDAIEELGPNAVPMQILKVMNVPWITRANVASHLQKFKNALRGQVHQSSQQARNVFSYNMNSAAGQYSMTRGMNISPYIPPKLSVSSILPLGTNQHLQNHKVHNLASNMLNNVPLPSRNVQTSHPPVPQFNGLCYSSLGNYMTDSSYSFNQPVPVNMSAATSSFVDGQQQNNVFTNGQNYGHSMNNMYPQQVDWKQTSEIKTSNFNGNTLENTKMEPWSMHNNNLVVNPADTFENSNIFDSSNNYMNVYEELDAITIQPINTNLSDEDENDEFSSLVHGLNDYEGPPCL